MDKNRKVDAYKRMLLIRKFEDRASDLYAEGKLGGSVHLYSGEEAVAVGACWALRKDDYILSTHRGHGHLIAKGGNIKLMMAELMGKKTGYCKGKGGSMHITDPELGIIGANGIVGAGICIGAGAALACQRLYGDRVTVCFFGDGAANRGTFHEGLNMASAWKLPIVYICENNLYGISVNTRRVTNIKDIAVRAHAYGIPGVVVDGMDVEAVNTAVTQAVERARRGEGPTLIECKTYRFRNHWEGDPGLYRPEAEVEQWKAKDPLPRFAKKLIAEGLATEADIAAWDKESDALVEEAIEFGINEPLPEPEDALNDLYLSGVEVTGRCGR